MLSVLFVMIYDVRAFDKTEDIVNLPERESATKNNCGQTTELCDNIENMTGTPNLNILRIKVDAETPHQFAECLAKHAIA